MTIIKIPIEYLEAMEYKSFDEKRMILDSFICERVNALIDEIERLQARVNKLEKVVEKIYTIDVHTHA